MTEYLVGDIDDCKRNRDGYLTLVIPAGVARQLLTDLTDKLNTQAACIVVTLNTVSIDGLEQAIGPRK